MVFISGPWVAANGGPAESAHHVEQLVGERRSALRARTLLGGKVVYGSARYSFNCTVRNLSDRGARIQMQSSNDAPDDLHLLVVKTGVGHQARVMWRDGFQAGLAFTRSFDLNDAPADALGLRRLWIDMVPR